MSSLYENIGTEDSSVEGLIPKKVYFRDKDGDRGNDMVIDLSAEDIQKSIVNAIPSIEFSDRIHQILVRNMENTVFLKLLGHNIGYSILQTKGPLDCVWSIFSTTNHGQCPLIQHKLFLKVVMSWIKLLGLPRYLYKRNILMEIGGMIEKVTKLDMNTDNRARGHFSQMVVYINLNKPLVSQILVNGKVQKVEYEFYQWPWMLVERKSWRKVRDPSQMNANNLEKSKGGQSSGQLVSKMVDKDSPNELGFKGIIGLVRLNNTASCPYVGHVFTNRLAGGAHFENGESRKNLNETNKLLEFNGPLEALDESLGIASKVRVGNLDPSKHTVVIFKENKEPNVYFKDERNIGLIDMRYIGPSFTWQRGGTFEILDQALANDAWVTAFPQCLVFQLPHKKFDHRPLDLNLARGRHFRFLAGWTKHASFSSFVKDKWNYAGNMTDTLTDFTSYIKDWNRNVYGFLGSYKRYLIRKLSMVQIALDHSNSSHLVQQEMEIPDEFENVLKHEELFRLQTEVVGFERLYGEALKPMRDCLIDIFLWLDSSNIAFLGETIINEDIKRSLFDRAPLKAPRSDGYHALFFQSQWDTISSVIFEWVQGIFVGKPIESELTIL
ncbi:hypothetical protein Goshw_020552 [Gossypium schwendimanii]|uniref:DUF4283 domain-containing protein n=1 Tax=Gossypium schwendimanii TaxID=34291 RepID=A0A7J9MIV8_GOSSC|nr:hypothetical protein [Gossypium schwendimanii]